MTWATSVPILVFLGLSVLELVPIDVRQTDVRRASSLNAPYPRGGVIKSCSEAYVLIHAGGLCVFCNRVKVGFQVVEPPQQRTYSCDYLRLFYMFTSICQGYVFIGLCLFVKRITQKLLHRFPESLCMERWHMVHGRNGQIVVVIRITLR